MSTYTFTTADTTCPGHTAAEILAKMAEARQKIDRMSEIAMGGLAGLQIISTRYLPSTITEPGKKHKRRRWMTERYHARIQKKWTKRFGTRQVEVAYMINGGLYVNPGTFAELQRRVTRFGWAP